MSDSSLFPQGRPNVQATCCVNHKKRAAIGRYRGCGHGHCGECAHKKCTCKSRRSGATLTHNAPEDNTFEGIPSQGMREQKGRTGGQASPKVRRFHVHRYK